MEVLVALSVEGNAVMFDVDQELLGLPDIAATGAPIGFAVIEVGYLVAGDATGFIDIGLIIRQRQIAKAAVNRPATVQSFIARAADGAPLSIHLINKNNMV